MFFSQHHFWWPLLLPRLRKDITSAENGDNRVLYAKRECRVRATMDGKWSQQPEVTWVIGRTGSSLGLQSSSPNGNMCFNLEQCYLAFTAISAWFAIQTRYDSALKKLCVSWGAYVWCQIVGCYKRKDDVREVVQMHSDTRPPTPGVVEVAPWHGTSFLVILREGLEFHSNCPELSPSSQAHPVSQVTKFSLHTFAQA